MAAARARSSAARAAWAARRERGDASGAAAGADDDEPESLESVLARGLRDQQVKKPNSYFDVSSRAGRFRALSLT